VQLFGTWRDAGALQREIFELEVGALSGAART